MIDLDSYEAQAEEGELHVRQIIDVIRELRECRAERDAAIARAEAAEALAASRPEITPEDARDGAVITGLVRAMRESRGGLLGPNENFGGIGAALLGFPLSGQFRESFLAAGLRLRRRLCGLRGCWLGLWRRVAPTRLRVSI